jgi:hypothetical protein
MIIIPTGMSASQWAGQMSITLDRFGPVPVMQTDEEWREWATVINSLPTINAADPPRPDYYERFEDWAERFIQIEPLQEF